jgi:hypothetical protein
MNSEFRLDSALGARRIDLETVRPHAVRRDSLHPKSPRTTGTRYSICFNRGQRRPVNSYLSGFSPRAFIGMMVVGQANMCPDSEYRL